MSDVQITPREINKKSFDLEYSTQWRKEYEYLLSQGIKPSFIKMDKITGIRTYKYQKTPDLFMKLFGFYSMVKAEKDFREAEEILANEGQLFEGEIPCEFKLSKFTVSRP